ncbi:hypothetical protein GCM10028805_12190 [Spirosoma harenae]
MATVVTPTKSVPKQMLEDKKKIQEYLKTKDESKRPEGVQFAPLIPVSACTEEGQGK